MSKVAASGAVALRFPDGRAAESAAKALSPDNDGHLAASVDGSTLTLTTRTDSVMGLLRTLDDALACLRATGMD